MARSEARRRRPLGLAVRAARLAGLVIVAVLLAVAVVSVANGGWIFAAAVAAAAFALLLAVLPRRAG